MKTMLRVACLGVASGLFALACGGDKDSSTPGGGGNGESDGGATGTTNGGNGTTNAGNGTTNAGNGTTNGTANGTNGAGSNGTMTPGGCDTTPCEGRMFLGQALPACCIDDSTCGVGVAGNCFDPAQLDMFAGDGGISFGGDGGFSLGEDEVIVSDPACEDVEVEVMGSPTTLPGCCDQTGVCGASTEGFSSFMGFELPVMCVTSEEAQAAGVDAGAPVPCDYPSDAGGGAVDAGEGTADASVADGGSSDGG